MAVQPIQPAAPKPPVAQPAPQNPQENWAAQQALQQEKMANLNKQVGVYEQGVSQLGQAQAAGQSALRARSDQALAGSRGMLGGGRGLAMLQQAALTRGAAENEQKLGYQQAMQQAQLQAAGAQGELLSEKSKMLQQGAVSKGRANEAVGKAKSILSEVAGDQWFTFSDEDRKAVVQRIQREVLEAEADPAVRDALVQYMNDVATGKVNASGLYDT